MSSSKAPIPVDSGAGEELFALADAIAAVIGGSVAIEDLDTRVLAYSTIPDQRIDELRRQGILGRRVPDQPGQRAALQLHQYRTVLAATDVVRLPGLAEEELPRAAVAVRAGDLPLGTIWAIEDGTPLDAAGERALLDGARTAALHMLRRRSAAALELHAREQALRAGIDGTAPAKETAYRLGLTPSTPVTLLGFAPAGAGRGSAELLTRLGVGLGRHWAAVRPEAAVATGPRAVYTMVPSEDAASARRLAAQALAAGPLPRENPLRAAVSTLATGVAELPELRAEVDDVLRVTTGDVDAPVVAALADVHARVLLAHLADELNRRPRLRRPDVTAMLEYDRAHDTPYATSVTAWLDAVGNVGEAARRLTVHQNTLKYRLRRARELFGLDLDDPDDRLSCWLQLRVSLEPGS
ncbi:PucR family transcriptional regulator [Streptomyces luteolifulvus]|uniref:PucR family transcriptional regulator n=1 Tax=Streptomyces luteolifulvus TaxID=2615112 RepID=A0A6H9UNK4_9ACTN|nr:helix-turn-helix domain-containing protein [Streptomyces luteolifulvus]KAB1139243.1 PucR family transcriptional regulator [Streptomyces luteolifulvus]